MYRKLAAIVALVVLTLSMGVATPSAYAAGTARMTIRDINNVIKCQATAPNTCTFNNLIPGNFYTITLDDSTGARMSHAQLIGGTDAGKWVSAGYAVNYHGTTAPTCTYTATSTRWSADCNTGGSFPNNIDSIFLYGYPASSATDDVGFGITRYGGINPSRVELAYQTP